MNGIRLLAVAALILGGCGNFYPGDPIETKPRFSAALTGWTLRYRDLSGRITYAEFRGPDIEGTDSAVVPINLLIEGNQHPGEATLTDEQAGDMLAGRWYVVLKTEKYPAGEIQGPLVRTTR